jgi:LacI family transcriptional regulator
MGCKRIAHIAGCQTMNIFQARREGYFAALAKYKLRQDPSLVYSTTDLSYDEGTKYTKKLLRLENKPDGIFCANDNTAIAAIQTIKKANLKVPDDIAVVGFSNYPASTIIEPSLTTIDDQAFEMGQAAAKLLIRQIETKEHYISSETIIIKTFLIPRESTNRKKIQ